MKNAHHPVSLLRVSMALALPALGTVLAHAESAEGTDAKSGEEIIELSPFQISTSKDSGYKASNSIAGTRSNTPIKEIPLNIQVFTKDLAQDLNITNQIDLERYNAALINGGADARSSNPIQQPYNNFIFRGFVQNWGLRDGIRQYDPVDFQGLERVELVKGPAAPLYGLTYPGGVMNSITKDPDFRRNFVDLGASYGSFSEMRGTIDANFTSKTAGGNVGLRYNAAYSNTQDDREHSKGRVRFNQVAAAWRPFKDTEVKFLLEEGFRSKPNGLGYFSRGETDSKGAALGNGADVPLQITHPEIPWSWNWAGGNNRTIETSMLRGTITQKIGDDLVVSAYIQSSKRDNVDSKGYDAAGSGGAASWDMGWSSNGGIPTGWITLPNGQEVIRQHWHFRNWANTMNAYGIMANYKLNFDQFRNTFTVGLSAWKEHFHTEKWTQPGTTTNYWDYPVKAGIAIQPFPNPPSDYFADLSQWSRENNSNDYAFASWQATVWDKLHLNASANRTNLKLVQWGDGYQDTKAKTTKESKTSPMIGANYEITKEFALFAVHSSSLFPTTDKNSFSVQMPPVTGTSNEAGVKLDLFNGKVSGTISYYKIEQKGGSQNDSKAENLSTQRWDSMTDAQRAANFPGKTRNDLLGDLVPGAKQESKGFEADLIFQPTKEWQVVLSYANNDQKVVESTNKASIGQSTSGHIKDQYALVTKYSFTEGQMKGFAVGIGLQSAGKALQDYNAPSSAARYNPSTFFLEAFASYKFKAFGYNQSVQLNLKNLTQQDEFVGWKATGSSSVYATERYRVSTPVTWTLSYGLSF